MVITLKITATSETLSISAPQANLSLQVGNVVAYDTDRQVVFAVGQTAEDLQSAFPVEWEKRETPLEFFFPFDADRFVPTLATAVVQYYAMMTYAEPRPAFKSWLTELYDRFDLDLHILDYERLPESQRHEFEATLLSNDIIKVRQLSINGQPPTVEGGSLEERSREVRTAWFATLTFLGCFAIWVVGLAGGAWFLFKTITPPAVLSKSIEWSDVWVILFAALVVLPALVYTGWVFGGITFALIGQNFVPPTNLRHFLLSPKVGMPKSIMIRLLNRLQHTSQGGG
ncbi:hypothetical protein BAC2_03510 [uncultured bacterium]|nr:hypothetical protein BAC2_03510 [uncultured bacterium]